MAAQNHTQVPTLIDGELTAGLLLARIGYLYRHHFGGLLACSAIAYLPLLPMTLFPLYRMLSGTMPPLSPGNDGLLTWLLRTEMRPVSLGLLAAGWVMIYFVAVMIATGATSMLIADVCLGNRPSALRSLRRVLSKGRWWKLALTSLMAFLLALAGLVLLIVPFFWVMAATLFLAQVNVLEGRYFTAAIRRCFALSKGQRWRISALASIPLIGPLVVGMVLGIALAMVGLALHVSQTAGFEVVAELINFGFSCLIAPAISAGLVLLYYEQRVRREDYDIQAMAEDIAR